MPTGPRCDCQVSQYLYQGCGHEVVYDVEERCETAVQNDVPYCADWQSSIITTHAGDCPDCERAAAAVAKEGEGEGKDGKGKGAEKGGNVAADFSSAVA